MHNDLHIQCSNYTCQAQNPEQNRFCQTCRDRIPKRYLWAVGLDAKPGDFVGDRYAVKQHQIVLDTKPGVPPKPIDITPRMEPYLRLMAERPAVPQLYAVVDDIFLLESAPIYPDGAHSTGKDLTGQLMPALLDVWKQSAALRQLNFLWQIAQLWRSLSAEKVTATLLEPNLLRADGGMVRLLELKFDRAAVPSLINLGQVWSEWTAQPEISQFFDRVCQNLIQSEITTADQLVDVLSQALASHSQQQTRRIQIATSTDQGPSRPINEDACYPPSGTVNTIDPTQSSPIVIVCDGIGGHEGGEVASGLAIQAITEHTQTLSEPIEHTLENAVLAANDAIAEQNDTERRQERQRMGTTVVMGLVHAHELYLTHVGDSRAYRITRTGCYQVTLDDDVASREVRLGYTLYREALEHPSAGSLVQALGMGSSSYLHPTVQRFVIDEDCVFLLCSDGLSDHDRVEECWQSDIVPLLSGKADAATVARKLVQIANARNGHDNVTIGLIYCQISDAAQSKAIPIALAQPTATITAKTAPPSRISKTAIPDPPARVSLLKIGLMLLGLFGVAGALAALLVPELIPKILGQRSSPAPVSSPIAEPTSTPLTEFIRVETPNTKQSRLLLLNKVDPSPAKSAIVGQISPGTVLKIIGRQQASNQPRWWKLKVCTPGISIADVKTTWAKAGETGWQQEDTIAPLTTPIPTPAQLGACAEPSENSSSPQ